MPLDSDQIEKFKRDGYLVVDAGLSTAVLDGIVTDLSKEYGSKNPHISYSDDRRIQDAWKVSSNVLNAVLAPNILDALAQLYGRKPLPFQTLNFRYGSEQKIHSDTIHFNSLPRGFMCGVWLALEDIDESNGPLVYYPGSQLLPEITMQDVGARPHHLNYGQYEDFIEGVLENRVEKWRRENKMEPSYGLIRKGHALIWASNLFHGGAPHKDKSRTRHSQVTHYFFEDCSFWRPMHSNDRFTFRIYPSTIGRGPVREHRVRKALNGIRWRIAHALNIV